MISFEIDERPLSLVRPALPDYIGRLLLSALYEPLLRWNSRRRRVEAGAAAAWSCSADHRDWEFLICESAKWHDGQPMRAKDAFETLVDAAAHPFWCRFISPVESMETEGDRILRVRLRHAIPFFDRLLTAVEIGPKPAAGEGGADRLCSGPYRLERASPTEYVLHPNRFAQDATKRTPIRFVVNADPDASAEGFRLGHWDVTSATGTRARGLTGELAGRLRTHRTGIYVQFEFAPDGVLSRSCALRQALFLAIEDEAIGSCLPDAIVPMRSFGPACFAELTAVPLPHYDPASARDLWRQGDGPEQIRIGYNPYYPNAELIRSCAAQWQDVLGTDVVALAFPFGEEPPSGCQASLALRFPAFPDAWSVIDQLLRFADAQNPGSGLWRRAANWLLEPQTPDGYLERLVAELGAAMPVLPLGEVVANWIERDTVRGFEIPDDACFSLATLQLCA